MISKTGGDDANNTSSGAVVVGDSSCPDGTEVSEEEDARRNEAYLAFFGTAASRAWGVPASVHVVQKQQSATRAREEGRDLDGQKR